MMLGRELRRWMVLFSRLIIVKWLKPEGACRVPEMEMIMVRAFPGSCALLHYSTSGIDPSIRTIQTIAWSIKADQRKTMSKIQGASKSIVADVHGREWHRSLDTQIQWESALKQ